MVPNPVFWTKYTATTSGSVVKIVPCEDCSTEYVYILERDASGVGTSVYMLNEEGAADHATSAAQDTLKSVLENDFDPVPCPACGHYQQYMFPKLLETKTLWGPALVLLVLLVGCLDTVIALYWTVTYLQRPSDQAFGRMVITWSILVFVCFIGLGLSLANQYRIRRFDPNLEDRQERITKGRSRAITRMEFETTLRGEHEPTAEDKGGHHSAM
jgi:hypothetical protein